LTPDNDLRRSLPGWHTPCIKETVSDADHLAAGKRSRPMTLADLVCRAGAVLIALGALHLLSPF